MTLLVASIAVLSGLQRPEPASEPSTAASAAAVAQSSDASYNVVVVMTDDMRADDLVHMPITQELLVDQGMTFTDAISPHPLCCPARAEVVTGLYAQNNGVQHNRGPLGGFQALDPAQDAGIWLRGSGYSTGFVGKFLNGYGPSSEPLPDWDVWNALNRGVYQYFDFTLSGSGTAKTFRDSYVTTAIDDATTEAVDTLAADGRPFLLHAWHLAPHYRIDADGNRVDPPYLPRDAELFANEPPPGTSSPAFNIKDTADLPAWVRRQPRVDVSAVTSEHRARLRALQSVDRAVGNLMASLERNGVADSTYVIFTSDNGYSLGEHRYVGKDVLMEPSMRVPLVIRGPGVVRGSMSDLPASIVDIQATIADLTGVAPTWVLDGTSLAPTLRGEKQPFRDTTLIQTGAAAGDSWGWRGVRTAQFTYASNGVEETLFDRISDPAETVNLASDPAYSRVRQELIRRLQSLVNCSGWSCNQQFGPLVGPQQASERRSRPRSRP